MDIEKVLSFKEIPVAIRYYRSRAQALKNI